MAPVMIATNRVSPAQAKSLRVFVADDDGVVGLLVLIATPARLLIENVAAARLSLMAV